MPFNDIDQTFPGGWVGIAKIKPTQPRLFQPCHQKAECRRGMNLIFLGEINIFLDIFRDGENAITDASHDETTTKSEATVDPYPVTN